MIKKSIIAIDKLGGLLAEDGQFTKEGKDKEQIRRNVRDLLSEIAEINNTLNDRSVDFIPDYKDWSHLKSKRESKFEEVWELYSAYHGIVKEKTIAEMTVDEFNQLTSKHPINQTINVNAPCAQMVAHADTIITK